MKSKLFLVLWVFLFGSYAPYNEVERDRVIIDLIRQGLEMSHYSTREINDEFSEDAFQVYLERLDYNKRFLLREDVEKLKRYERLIDDAFVNADEDLLNLAMEIVNKRITLTRSFAEAILSHPFDFTIDETFETNPEKLDYATDEEELKDRWRKALKLQTLIRLNDMVKMQEEAGENQDSTIEVLPFDSLEAKARRKVYRSIMNWYNRLDKLEKADRFAEYINAIINTYDPHTEYYPPREKENFDISMSGKLEGIGATLTERNGYIKVERIIPGSACWRQGELEVGDIILKVAQGDEEPIDVVDMRLDKAVQLIRGPKGTEVRLTVKKIDGTIKVIPIIRDVVIIEETYAKSAIIRHDKLDLKVGIIDLPKFYADFNKKNGRRCADDIRKEVEKLKADGVDAIIIDLRNNGGGSLEDVIKMVGWFIETGPVVQVKDKIHPANVYRDNDPTIVYDGPLAVMVNEFSASASEIFAAAIQDYGRGVVIGSHSTYGKGTVQRFFDLDAFLSAELNHIKPLGSIKLTTNKFYRINGGATQLKGVTPDIILPDEYDLIEVGERELDFALPWTQTEPVNYRKWPVDYHTALLKKRSQERVERNETFSLIREKAEWLKQQREESEVTLNYETYRNKMKSDEKKSEYFKRIKEEIPDIHVEVTSADKPEYDSDEAEKERRDAWHKRLKKDVHLQEALFVVNDMVNQ